jgi:uncharacterized protein YukE
MTTIRVNPEELEAVAEHVPDAEDGCSRARTSLSWEFPSLVMKIPGISTAAIDSLRDELIHWLDRYEEKLNEAEELLYRTAAAIRQADQTLADNMKEFGLELLGWYDLQRLFGEYDPVTGERISGWDRLVAGGMLLASFVPPVKGAGVAGKAGIKGLKAAETAADVSKWISKTRNVLNVNKIKGALQTIYYQVIKGPITATIRSFKQQWEQLLENIGSVLMGPRPALAGVGGPTSRMWMSGAEREAKETTMNMIGKTEDEVVGKGTGKGKRVSDIPRIPEIEISFKRNPKHDAAEFERQLKAQEEGINSLTVDEFIKNRDRYLKDGRALEGDAAQRLARQEALKEKVAELRKQGLSREEAKKQAEEWLETQAALHNPDQIAGGNPSHIGGMGDKKINSSIGSQWKSRIKDLDKQIRDIAKTMTQEERESTFLNIKLKISN